ncbi:MAG: diguanylate cyclase [Alphaproteobacteria bacterium]
MKALILEDNDKIAKLYKECAESIDGLEVQVSPNYRDFSDKTARTVFDLFVIDNILPDKIGLDVISELRAQENFSHTPIIMLTSENSREICLEALSRGATDFLSKPIDMPELLARLRNMISLREYHLLINQEKETLEKLATTDSLTEVWNRRSFMDRLQREIHRAHRFEQSLTVAMMDADHFKSVNDTYGHPVGDQVLIGIAKAAKKRLRDIDIIGRLGGEEFALCLTQTSGKGGHIVADRIREDIEAMMFDGGRKDFGVTVSVGLAEWRRGETATGVLERADQALYEAKHGGRNQVKTAA